MAGYELFRLQTRSDLGSSAWNLNVFKRWSNEKSRELNPTLENYYQHDPLTNYYHTVTVSVYGTQPYI